MNSHNFRQFHIPDAFYCINHGNLNHYFLLEIDRGTIGAKFMLKRYQNYYQWWKNNGAKIDLGVSSIRILTVTTCQRRMDNLVKACFRVKGNNTGSALFWFTTAQNVNIFRPQFLLGRIWRKALPNNSTLYSLLD